LEKFNKEKLLLKGEIVSLIIKARQMPVQLISFYFYYRRIPMGHPKKSLVLGKLKRLHAGFLGEKEFDYFLNLFSNDRFLTLNDLRLNYQDHIFQIDTLILSNYFEILVEIKNYKGVLFFDQLLEQCTRTYNDIEDSISDPIAQTFRHQKFLSLFKKEQGMKTLPQIPLVIISHSTTMIKTNPGLEKELTKKVLHAEHFPKRLNDLYKTHPNRRLSDGQLLDFANQLVKRHEPPDTNLPDSYKIPSSDLIKGVQCPTCDAFSMNWTKASWQCPLCKTTSKTAHEQAIYEYLLIVNPTINYEQCREFLNLHSRELAKRLLRKLKLPSRGTTKDRVYFLPSDWIQMYEDIKFDYSAFKK
jgi:hypothetical protein